MQYVNFSMLLIFPNYKIWQRFGQFVNIFGHIYMTLTHKDKIEEDKLVTKKLLSYVM